MPQASEMVTMSAFQQACNDRLDEAIASGEAERHELPSGVVHKFETPAGLEFTRFTGQVLVVRCDVSELEDDAPLEYVNVNFSTVPPQATIDYIGDRGAFSRTVPLADHDKLATDLAKYITLAVD